MKGGIKTIIRTIKIICRILFQAKSGASHAGGLYEEKGCEGGVFTLMAVCEPLILTAFKKPAPQPTYSRDKNEIMSAAAS